MAREKEDFRDNLALLNDRFPDHDMLTVEEIMIVTGYKSKNSVRKIFPLVNARLSKVALARWMCG